ncbi:MAG: methyltransferase domain-containing protein [Eggerthellaceae bacterium]|nr:methyltransferase domain-containing protein [Eggerthellaceae bacterium]
MSRKASEFQYKAMSLAYRGKEVFKPLGTGWIDERVACVREYIANVFFYVKGGDVLMVDAGYNYDRLAEKMGWLGIDPARVRDILITHQDTDHVGAVESDSPGLFRDATLYVGEEEDRYLTGERRRRVYWGAYRLPQVTVDNDKVLLRDGQAFDVGSIHVEAFLVPGHTWGHMVYLVDGAYLFTGDAIWFGPDGGRAFLDTLAEDNKLSCRSLARLEARLRFRGLSLKVITGHTGWSADLDFAFARVNEPCHAMFRQRPHDPSAPYDGYVEDDDTEESARAGLLPEVVPVPNYENWVPRYMAAGSAAGAAGLAAAASIAGRLRAPKALTAGLAVAAAGCGAFAAWASFARKHFAFDAGGSTSRRIVEGVASYVDVADGGTCLDVGCGSGALSIAVAKRNPGANVVGVDRWGAEYASFSQGLCERNAAAEGATNVTFQEGDARELPFPDETFDTVCSNYVYHNITGADRQVLLRETLRCLRKGGAFAIHDLMERFRFGDMQAFCEALRAEGYEDVRLVPTADGLFMERAEALPLMLAGSCLLVGKK